ncbi:hypothetical protein BGZ65_012503 [Modicella reniformis]|uniref:Uncharacterized protein n=1 Tax=Modicella reniformis TaxID=1440133 RepID=A0A9P6J3A6_9FUNG|nr:hypothetical protein BGZ65_012503 [Modicella reniformis]
MMRPRYSESAKADSDNNRSKQDKSPTFKWILSSVFTFFLILYVTGGSIHTAAVFFKQTIALFLKEHSQDIGLSTHPPTDGNGQLSMELAQQLKQGYLLMQDEWEHTISHYMYALGALGMSWCEMIAYAPQTLPVKYTLNRVGHAVVNPNNGRSHLSPTTIEGQTQNTPSSWLFVAYMISAGFLYGTIVAGVACQYPKGLIVGTAYVSLLLLTVGGYFVYKGVRTLAELGRHHILATYLIGGIVATAIIFIYMAINNFDLLTSNDKSHNGSYSRP